jgi:Flp pilus assembly protein TadB
MLAIIRRKMEGRSVSSADDQHIHHMLRRAAGVRGAVFILYGIAAVFACAAAMVSFSRARMIYLIVLLLVSYIAVTAIKIARRRHIEQAAAACLSSDQPGIVGATISGPGLPLQQPGEAAAPPEQAPGSLSPLTTPPLPTTPAAT